MADAASEVPAVCLEKCWEEDKPWLQSLYAIESSHIKVEMTFKPQLVIIKAAGFFSLCYALDHERIV